MCNNIQNGGFSSVNFYKTVFIFFFFSPSQVSLAQLFHVLCRQKGKPYLNVYELARLRPRWQGVIPKLIYLQIQWHFGVTKDQETGRICSLYNEVRFIEILFHIFYNNCRVKKIASYIRNSSYRGSLYRL